MSLQFQLIKANAQVFEGGTTQTLQSTYLAILFHALQELENRVFDEDSPMMLPGQYRVAVGELPQYTG